MTRMFTVRRQRMALAVFVLLLTQLLAVVQPQSAAAAGVVTQCDEIGLRAAMQGGGEITFNGCGTIPITSPIVVTSNTVIDGGGLVTLDGQQMTQLFQIASGVTVELNGLTLANGRDRTTDVGAITNQGQLSIVASTLTGHVATNGRNGGAIYNTGTLSIVESTFSSNSADGGAGGAIYNAGGTLSITSSELRRNSAGASGGAIYNTNGGTVTIDASTFSVNSATGDGGAIANQGELSITASTLTGNSVTNGKWGGAIYNTNTLTISESTLNENTAAAAGGAISSVSGTVAITASELSGNSAGATAGAVQVNGGTATITASTLSDNHSDYSSGAIYVASGASATITASTLANNSAADFGGALVNGRGGTVTINASTLGGNQAVSSGFAIYAYDGSTTTITASILGDEHPCAGNGAYISHGYNVGSDTSCHFTAEGDVQGVNPILGELQDNGGPTDTILPAAGSPALERVPNAVCATLSAANEGRDQRGVVRPIGNTPCDSGSVEVTTSIQDITVDVSGSQVTLTVTAEDPLGGVIFYRFECNGEVIGPQTSSSATCDFGHQTGQFAVQVEAADVEGIGMTETVVVEIPTYLCVGERSGTPQLMDGQVPCGRGEQSVVMTSAGSWSFCVSNRTGNMQYLFNPDTNCLGGETKLTLPEQGPITVCVGERSGSMQYATDASQCSSRGEQAYRIANKVS